MTDPSTGMEVAGTPVSSLLAAVAGALASLSFVPGLSRTQAILTVMTGTVSAVFLEPLIAAVLSNYLTISPVVERALVFSIGLLAMAVLPGILKFARRFAENPLAMWRGNSSGEGQ